MREMDEENPPDVCDHDLSYGRQRKYDSGRCPVLCGACRLIVGWWTLDAFGEVQIVEGDTITPEKDYL